MLLRRGKFALPILFAMLFACGLGVAGARENTMQAFRKILEDPAAMREGGETDLVRVGDDGRLEYGRDADSNRICDFSFAGYRGGGVAIPDVPVVLSIEPGDGGDDTTRIQAAIDEVGRKPLGTDGFRGALLLKRGKYVVSNTLHFRKDGVVVRGEGAGFGGTWIFHKCAKGLPDPKPNHYIHWPQPERGMVPTLLTHGGSVKTKKLADITNPLVAAGADRLTLSDVSGIRPGDEIVVVSPQTQKWIDDLGLGKNWKPEQFRLTMPRIVKEVRAKTKEIVLNVPVTTRLDRASGYTNAEVHSVVRDGRLRHIGVEDILFLSDYDRSKRGKKDYFNDERHPNYTFRFYNARDGWMRRCVAFFYSCGIVSTGTSQHLTIEDCAMIDGVSTDTPVHHVGTRKYYFNAQGDQLLFQRCYARYARHAFIGNSPHDGGVWLDCFSERDHLKSEWHQRWGHGHLFDNIASEAQIGLSGNHSSHGQKCAFALGWNNLINNRRTYEPDLFVNRIPGIVTNYAVGNILLGSRRISNDEHDGRREATPMGETGRVDSSNRFVAPRSLYLAQLRDRLGDDAVRSIATRKQIEGPRGAVWLDLVKQFAHFPEWPDPAEAPWPGYENWVAEFDAPAAKTGEIP